MLWTIEPIAAGCWELSAAETVAAAAPARRNRRPSMSMVLPHQLRKNERSCEIARKCRGQHFAKQYSYIHVRTRTCTTYVASSVVVKVVLKSSNFGTAHDHVSETTSNSQSNFLISISSRRRSKQKIMRQAAGRQGGEASRSSYVGDRTVSGKCIIYVPYMYM